MKEVLRRSAKLQTSSLLVGFSGNAVVCCVVVDGSDATLPTLIEQIYSDILHLVEIFSYYGYFSFDK